jgi:predicted metal-binding protein
MTDTRKAIEVLAQQHRFEDFKWIDPAQIVVSQWVRMKCMYGCRHYGDASCPPNVPSIDECRDFIGEYNDVLVIHESRSVSSREERYAWTGEINRRLLELEREVFIGGNPRAFLLFLDTCRMCDECGGARSECNQPKSSRPTPEGMGIDVFTTVQNIGYPIEVLSSEDQTMNRYAFLLVS